MYVCMQYPTYDVIIQSISLGERETAGGEARLLGEGSSPPPLADETLLWYELHSLSGRRRVPVKPFGSSTTTASSNYGEGKMTYYGL